MIVVIPLRTKEPGRRVHKWHEQACIIVIVFQNKMDVPSGRGCQGARGLAHLIEQHRTARLNDRMNGVEPQPVETVGVKPMQCVFDRKLTDLRDPIIDCIAPRCLSFGEERRRVAAEVISLRTEVVVNDVKEYHQPAMVCGVDERLQVVRPAISTVRSKRQNAVVAPVPASGEVGNWHQLNGGKSCFAHVIKLLDRRAERALFGERSDMQLQERTLVPGSSIPAGAVPRKRMVDDLALPVYIIRLEMRGGVRHVDVVVDPELVTRSRSRTLQCGCKPSVAGRRHLVKALANQRNRTRCGCPEPEFDAVLFEPGAEPPRIRHGRPARAITDWAGLDSLVPTAFSDGSDVCGWDDVSSTVVQCLVSAHFGRSISMT